MGCARVGWARQRQAGMTMTGEGGRCAAGRAAGRPSLAHVGTRTTRMPAWAHAATSTRSGREQDERDEGEEGVGEGEAGVCAQGLYCPREAPQQAPPAPPAPKPAHRSATSLTPQRASTLTTWSADAKKQQPCAPCRLALAAPPCSPAPRPTQSRSRTPPRLREGDGRDGAGRAPQLHRLLGVTSTGTDMILPICLSVLFAGHRAAATLAAY